MFLGTLNPSNSPGRLVANVPEGIADDVDIKKCSINVTFIRSIEQTLKVVDRNSSDDLKDDYVDLNMKILS